MKLLTRSLALLFGIVLAFAVDAAPAYRSGSGHDCGFQASNGSGQTTCVFSGAVSLGDMLYACIRIENGHAVTAFADDINGAWTQVETTTTGTGATVAVCFYFCNSAAGTPTTTLTEAGVANNNSTLIVAYSGVATTSCLVASNKADIAAGASTLTGASASATAANQLLIGFVGGSAGSSITPGNGETERLGDASFAQLEDKLTGGSGSVAPQWAFSPDDAGQTVTAIFAATAGVNRPLSGPLGGPLSRGPL